MHPGPLQHTPAATKPARTRISGGSLSTRGMPKIHAGRSAEKVL
jgi:hypothetical protein